MRSKPAIRTLAACILAGTSTFSISPAALAGDFQLGEFQGSIKGNVTAGIGKRVTERNAELLQTNNAATLAIPGYGSNGRNQDDGDLNYAKGDTYSRVVKAVVDVDLKRDNLGIFLRAKGWHDFALEDDLPLWGNIPNGMTSSKPLSDAGFGTLGRFSGVALADAYLYGAGSPGGVPLSFRLGNQTIGWGAQTLIAGGLRDIDPVDLPASRRPGALPSETRIPFPAIWSQFKLSDRLMLDAFYQFKWIRSQSPVCGTFFSAGDFGSGGCDKGLVGGTTGTDRTQLASGLFMNKSPDNTPSDSGEFGLALKYGAPQLNTDFGAYMAQYHSRVSAFEIIKSRRATGAPAVAGDPGGLNPTYRLAYPEDIRVYGASFSTTLQDGRLYGEITYRPNQVLKLNAGDLLAAFTTPATTAAHLRADERAMPLGGVFRGYDRYGMTQAQLGGSRNLAKLIGDVDVTIAGEVAGKFISGLPDQTVRRYGRADVYGNGPINGVCTGLVTEKRCTNDGYFTPSAWGLRARASANIPNALPGVTLIPGVAFGWDVDGYSYDGMFSKGRRALGLSLRANYRQLTAEIAVNLISGGRYDNSGDRDHLMLSAGMNF